MRRPRLQRRARGRLGRRGQGDRRGAGRADAWRATTPDQRAGGQPFDPCRSRRDARHDRSVRPERRSFCPTCRIVGWPCRRTLRADDPWRNQSRRHSRHGRLRRHPGARPASRAGREAARAPSGVPVETFPRLVGLRAWDDFISALSRRSGEAAPTGVRRRRSQLVDAMLDGHFHFGGERIAIAAEPDLLSASPSSSPTWAPRSLAASQPRGLPL